jgi:hypothetical protein
MCLCKPVQLSSSRVTQNRVFATEIEYLLPDHRSLVPKNACQHDRRYYVSTHNISSAWYRHHLTRSEARQEIIADFPSYTVYGARHTSPEPTAGCSVRGWTSCEATGAGTSDASAILR